MVHIKRVLHGEALPYVRQLVTGLLPWSPGFCSSSVLVGFAVYLMLLEKVFLGVLWFFPCHYHSIHAPYAFIRLSLILYNFTAGWCVLAGVCSHAHRHTHTHTHTTLSVVLLNGHHICVIEI